MTPWAQTHRGPNHQSIQPVLFIACFAGFSVGCNYCHHTKRLCKLFPLQVLQHTVNSIQLSKTIIKIWFRFYCLQTRLFCCPTYFSSFTRLSVHCAAVLEKIYKRITIRSDLDTQYKRIRNEKHDQDFPTMKDVYSSHTSNRGFCLEPPDTVADCPSGAPGEFPLSWQADKPRLLGQCL